jgi:hypothetical protein
MSLTEEAHLRGPVLFRVHGTQQCFALKRPISPSPQVKATGLTQTLGQLLKQSLIGNLSQTAGSTRKLCVNPVNFRFHLQGHHSESFSAPNSAAFARPKYNPYHKYIPI